MDATEGLAPVDELIELGERMKRDKARLIELCRAIAGGQDAVREASIELPKPARRGGLRKVNKVNRVNKVKKVKEVSDSPAEKIRKEYWRKVACVLCGTVTGAIRRGDGIGVLYTCRHKNPASGESCKGSDMAATIVTE